jgi:hypothetical protein
LSPLKMLVNLRMKNELAILICISFIMILVTKMLQDKSRQSWIVWVRGTEGWIKSEWFSIKAEMYPAGCLSCVAATASLQLPSDETVERQFHGSRPGLDRNTVRGHQEKVEDCPRYGTCSPKYIPILLLPWTDDNAHFDVFVKFQQKF